MAPSCVCPLTTLTHARDLLDGRGIGVYSWGLWAFWITFYVLFMGGTRALAVFLLLGFSLAAAMRAFGHEEFTWFSTRAGFATTWL